MSLTAEQVQRGLVERLVIGHRCCTTGSAASARAGGADGDLSQGALRREAAVKCVLRPKREGKDEAHGTDAHRYAARAEGGAQPAPKHAAYSHAQGFKAAQPAKRGEALGRLLATQTDIDLYTPTKFTI